jgi:hypothetical protein
MDVCRECCVFSGRGLCDGLITRPEKSYRLYIGDRTNTTQQSGQTLEIEEEINHIMLMSAATRNRSDCLAQASGFISSRQSDQTPAALCLGFESCCNRQNVFNWTCLRYAASLGPKKTMTEISSQNFGMK